MEELVDQGGREGEMLPRDWESQFIMWAVLSAACLLERCHLSDADASDSAAEAVQLKEQSL